MDKAQALLEGYGLRKTGCRLEVLHQFLEHDFALSHADLEKVLGHTYDRVTIYRTLYSFEEKGLIHSINDVSGAVKFAICKDDTCSQDKHQENHIHFNCNTCGQTFCLNEVGIPRLTLPNGYTADRLHFSAEGVCKGCSQDSSI
ncbi:Fur family transcriptional regulator [Pontibacter litorisediminis]|uniref:Fur family transcriptional regulator n=1 Tax=Pontibacter litorisediminis TaxID=1846260 RepID=UPI0023EB9D21|nr:transcriptional repressor [Pontibacter litorisediminis]